MPNRDGHAPLKLFYSYSHKDEESLAKLRAHMTVLRDHGLIEEWWDRNMRPGDEWKGKIDNHLEEADIILLLVSRDYLQSHYCYKIETPRAMERHLERSARVVPVMLRSCRIKEAPFYGLVSAPADWKPIEESLHPDQLYMSVADGVADLAERLSERSVCAAPKPAPKTAQPTVGTFRVNPVDRMEYAWIPPGRFVMGCSPGDTECIDAEKPAHSVEITRGFWLSRTPVTQAAYKRVMGSNPSHFKGDDLPVESVDWDAARDYCVKVGGRLPTEAEWEYAARGGTTGARYGELEAIAWYDVNSGGKTHSVGTKLANAYGLYDMLGNVWEWTADWDAGYQAGSMVDPSGPSSGSARVIRGGGWSRSSWIARASDRDEGRPGLRFIFLGFRCVREQIS